MGKLLSIPYDHFDLDLSSNTYSPKNSLSMALACQLSYQSESVISKQLGEWGFSRFVKLNAQRGLVIDTQGFVATNDEITLVTFRGSESFRTG